MARAADGTTIAYATAPAASPDAPRVALVHSLALDHGFWDGVARSVSGRLSLLALDCRGHGASARAPGPYDAALMADDLASALDDAGWDRALVAGCSMGGCVAIAFASRHPDRTAGLLAIDTTAWYGPDAPTAWAARAERARQGGMAALLPFQRDRWFSAGFRAAHPDVEAHHEAVFLANDTACYAAACAMLGATDLRAAAQDIRAPTAVVVGEEDHATPPAMADELAALIPGATLTVLRGARHLTPIERPAEIAEALLALTVRAGA